ncbi:unnamed protein product, partial [Closterium sp. NIES-54]
CLKSQPGDEATTLLLLAFARLILAVPPKPGIGQKVLITERLGAFWEGRWRELFDSAMVAAWPAVRPLSYTCSDQDPDAIRLSRCRSRCKVGEWSRGLACLTAGELARPSEAMVQSLREKHLASAGKVPQWVRDFTIDTAQRPSLTTDILARAIHTAARASAAGPSGWVTEHLRDTFLTEPSCLSLLLEVFNQWVAGQVPERARPWLAASNLVGFSKPNGDVPPVAIGEVLPRILARALCISLRPAMVSYFLPCNQLGAGTRVGVEILTHSFWSTLATHPDLCALQIDVANAFNSFHRHVMFDGLRESPFSGMIPFLRVFYGTPSDLYLLAGPFVQSLESARGSRQGDPLGPFLFAFTQQQVMEPVTREFKDLLSSAMQTIPIFWGQRLGFWRLLGCCGSGWSGWGWRCRHTRAGFGSARARRWSGHCHWGCSRWMRVLLWWACLLGRRFGGGPATGAASTVAGATAMAPIARPPSDGFTPPRHCSFCAADVPRPDYAAAFEGG